MPLTRKFSQFVAQNVSSVVGLTGGANSIGPNSGGGGSGAVTQVIVQANSFTVGQWIRFDVASNLYVTALATTPLNAEVIGVVIAATATQFTLQQSGYITAVQAVFAGLLDGEPYFLDNVVAGNMVTTDVLIDGEVSRPVFIPDSPASGWVLPYRGVIVGGGPDTGGSSPSPSTDSNVVTVVQNGHGFNPGQWVRVDTPTVGPNQVHYVLAIANSLANSQSVGVVIEVINPNEFVLQFAGYIATNGTVFAPFQDQAAVPLVPKTVYYLSSTVAGAITSVDPGLTPGNFSKPLYISEQTIGTVNYNAGYILPQRPLDANETTPTNIIPVNQVGHGFYAGDYLRVLSSGVYTLAQADSAVDVIGVGFCIEVVDANNFILQTSGYCGEFVPPYRPGSAFALGITAASEYFLSDTVVGGMQIGSPAPLSSYSKPIFISLTTTTGFIEEQRPLLNSVLNPGGGGGGIIQVVSNTVTANTAFVAPLGIWTAFPGYTVTITLSNAANKVKLSFNFCWNIPGLSSQKIRLTRNGIVIPGAVNVAANGGTIGYHNADLDFIVSSILYVDTPGAVGPFTYGVQVLTNFAGTVTQNYSITDAFPTGISTFVAEEIV